MQVTSNDTNANGEKQGGKKSAGIIDIYKDRTESTY